MNNKGRAQSGCAGAATPAFSVPQGQSCPLSLSASTDTTSDLAQRLRDACDGRPHAKIPWPHRLLHEAAEFVDASNGRGKPFAWWRIVNGQAVAYVGENPPNKDAIWSPLYRAPVHTEHRDTERMRWICDGFDGFGDLDFHAEACKLAGGDEPRKEHYLMAYRAIIDSAMARIERCVPYNPDAAE